MSIDQPTTLAATQTPRPRLVEVPLTEAQPGDVNVRAWLDGTVVAIVIDDRHYTSPLLPKFGVSSVVFRPTVDPSPADPDAAALDRLERWLNKSTVHRAEFAKVGLGWSVFLSGGLKVRSTAPTLAAAIMSALAAAGAPQ